MGPAVRNLSNFPTIWTVQQTTERELRAHRRLTDHPMQPELQARSPATPSWGQTYPPPFGTMGYPTMSPQRAAQLLSAKQDCQGYKNHVLIKDRTARSVLPSIRATAAETGARGPETARSVTFSQGLESPRVERIMGPQVNYLNPAVSSRWPNGKRWVQQRYRMMQPGSKTHFSLR